MHMTGVPIAVLMLCVTITASITISIAPRVILWLMVRFYCRLNKLTINRLSKYMVISDRFGASINELLVRSSEVYTELESRRTLVFGLIIGGMTHKPRLKLILGLDLNDVMRRHIRSVPGDRINWAYNAIINNVRRETFVAVHEWISKANCGDSTNISGNTMTLVYRNNDLDFITKIERNQRCDYSVWEERDRQLILKRRGSNSYNALLKEYALSMSIFS